MRILIHCGAGNTDRPGRWHGIAPVFTNLGEALIDLGHDVHMMIHGAAQNVCTNGTRIKLHVTNPVDIAYINAPRKANILPATKVCFLPQTSAKYPDGTSKMTIAIEYTALSWKISSIPNPLNIKKGTIIGIISENHFDIFIR